MEYKCEECSDVKSVLTHGLVASVPVLHCHQRLSMWRSFFLLFSPFFSDFCSISHLPRVLVLTLKRFEYHMETGRQSKRNHPINIPIVLNVGKLA